MLSSRLQDFNLFYLRIKKSTDGELVVIPMAKLVGNKFTNLSRCVLATCVLGQGVGGARTRECGMPLCDRYEQCRPLPQRRSDWKIEQNYFAVDLTTPPSILAELKEAVMEVRWGASGTIWVVRCVHISRAGVVVKAGGRGGTKGCGGA